MTAHECITEKTVDSFAGVEQYQVRCRCHMDVWHTWRPGDRAIVCPSSGIDLTVGEPK